MHQITMYQVNQTLVLNNKTPNNTVLHIIRHSEVFYATALALSCLIIVMNAFVLVIFQLKKKLLLKSPANIILCSFTVNDAIAGSSIILHVIPYYLMYGGNVSSTRYANIVIASYILPKQCLLSSVGHLLLLSCDRFLAIASPLTHHLKLSKTKAIVYLLVVWSLAITFPLLEYLLREIIDLKIYILVIAVCFVLIPLAILLHQYIITFLLIRKSIKDSQRWSWGQKSNCKKAVLLHLVMFISFVICVVPYVSMRLIFVFKKEQFQRVPQYVNEITFLLRFLTSFTNPLIYTIYKTDFQNIIKAIRKKLQHIIN